MRTPGTYHNSIIHLQPLLYLFVFYFVLLSHHSGDNFQTSQARAHTRMFFFMNPLTGDIWFYVALAYVLVSLSMWIIARFSPLEWYLAKQQNFDESFCHEHNHHQHATAAEEMVDVGHSHQSYCCEHLSPPQRFGSGGVESAGQMDDKESFQASSKSDFNKHEGEEEEQVEVVQVEEHQQQQQQGEGIQPPPLTQQPGFTKTKTSNEFEISNEGCSCDNRKLPPFRPPAAGVNKREKPRDIPLDLLEDMPLFDEPQQQQTNSNFSMRHSHSELELLSSTNDFTLPNSFWFMIGTLMQQGSELNPKVNMQHMRICIIPGRE